jgi:hypothetical protein
LDNSTVKILVASVGVSFALGFGTASWLQDPAPEIAVAVAQPAPGPSAAVVVNWPVSVPAQPAAASALPATATVDELWTRALQQTPGYDAEDRLRKLAQSDPVALRSLLDRYSSTQTPQARELLKSVLSTVRTPDVIAFATRLAGSSNLVERKYGFEMLQSVAPDSAETRSLVKRTLASEQSPEVLVQALATLQSSVAEPDEADLMVAQLKSLSQHADPAVRSLSIQQLGQWDKRGEGAERLSQALMDRAPEVRQAAIFAIAQSGIRSEAAKAALMGLVNNPQESRDVRGSALQALERFSLSKEEYASFAQARGQVRGL